MMIEMMLTEQDIQDIVDRVVEVAAPEKIILFGSYATGTATEDSDVDLLVVKETAERFNRRTGSIRRALDRYPCAFDILVHTPEEYSLRRQAKWHIVHEAATSGRVLYDAK